MSRFIEEIPSADVFRSPQCNSCVHRISGTATCAAFPDRIPSEIITNEFDHRNPYPGDNGIRYEAKVPVAS